VVERIAYDEFGLFHENAAEYGLPYDGPPLVRREAVDVGRGRVLSALVWGEGDPELVLLHGGGQNAHTWDTVALALGRPLVAVDLPGHGHSDAPDPALKQLSPEGIARDVAMLMRRLAPWASGVVGMSLGGLTTIALADQEPDLVERIVLVDVTPGVNARKAQFISAFVNGPRTFDSFEALLARTIEHNPTRTVSSLRRGILHNAMQLDDGTWIWRYRRFSGDGVVGESSAGLDFGRLWESLGQGRQPLLLVRGMLEQSVVDDDDVAELIRRRPDASVIEVSSAGHSVQGDTPVELAGFIRDFCGLRPRG
jgi:pimeloyl-ACP methyl ester carboxylesterase